MGFDPLAVSWGACASWAVVKLAALVPGWGGDCVLTDTIWRSDAKEPYASPSPQRPLIGTGLLMTGGFSWGFVVAFRRMVTDWLEDYFSPCTKFL